jgi:chromate transporter
LALAQLAPGLLAAQLAIYIGYVHYRILGATLVGIAFVIPSFIMVVIMGRAYVKFGEFKVGGIDLVQAIFYGVGACVIGIIAMSAFKLTQKMVKGALIWGIYLTSLAITVITEAGAFVFGSGLAIVPFLYGGVVKNFQWLTDKQFLDAVAVAMITPGPVVIATGFIGYLVPMGNGNVAGLAGATVAALATFLSCYFFTILLAPYFKKYGKLPSIAAFVKGVTVAATGAIAGATIVFPIRSLTDIPTVILAIATIGLVIYILLYS